MTLVELSQQSGISVSFICELEAGKRRPSLDTADALAGVFGVSAKEAFEYIEVPA